MTFGFGVYVWACVFVCTCRCIAYGGQRSTPATATSLFFEIGSLYGLGLDQEASRPRDQAVSSPLVQRWPQSSGS